MHQCKRMARKGKRQLKENVRGRLHSRYVEITVALNQPVSLSVLQLSRSFRSIAQKHRYENEHSTFPFVYYAGKREKNDKREME